MPIPKTTSRTAAILAGATALVLALAACTPATETGSGASSPPHAGGLPSSHVHGLTVSAATGQVLLATHDGLFDVTKQPATKVGGTNDLMGFTAGQEPGLFYASGHPGPGSELPNPLGLLRTTDGGKTWEQLSRQRESDFHAMTTTKSGVVAFDGALRTSRDGKTWATVSAAFAPAVLAAHPGSDTVLATTEKGIQRSTDSGTTWTAVKSGPIIQFVAFATAAEVAGAEPDGTVHYSTDAGATWTKKGRIDGDVMAIAATKDANGQTQIWAATQDGIVVSTDGGMTFRPSPES